MSVLISIAFTGLTWGAERVSSVEIWKKHPLSSHRIQVGGLFRGLAKDPQISPAHLSSKGKMKGFTLKPYHRHCVQVAGPLNML